MLKLCNNFF